MNKEFKKALLEALTKDIDSWHSITKAAADWGWVEYHSKDYKSKSGDIVSFCVGNLNHGTCVYINGYVKYDLKYIPLISNTAFKIRKMKKHVKSKKEKIYLDELRRAVDFIKEYIDNK